MLYVRVSFELAIGSADAALADDRRALALFESWGQPRHPVRAYLLTGIGEANLRKSAPAAAVEPLEQALHQREADPSDARQLARTRFVLARALWSLGRDRRRARQLAMDAELAYARLGEAGRKSQAEVAGWLLRTEAR